jgi:ribonuclease Z
VEEAVGKLAATTLALLAGDEVAAQALTGGAEKKRELVRLALDSYDDCKSGTLSFDEAVALFTRLARSIVEELATGNDTREVARAQARRILDNDARGTIDRVANKLFLLADVDGDGRINLAELAGLFEAVQQAPSTETFPQPLRALAGSLQLLPPTEGVQSSDTKRAAEWHVGVPGDDHTLRQVELGRGLSVVGLGRSADASAYFLPELGICFDAGLHVKSLVPKCILLTHGHRDHTAALPAMAPKAKAIYTPSAITPLVRRFLLAEAQLNYGDAVQTDEETIAAIGDFRLRSVDDGYEQLLPRECYAGSPTPIGVQVFEAPHKKGVPAVAYGLYRSKSRLKAEYAEMPKHELGALLRKDTPITESYSEGLVWFSGDTTIELLRERHTEILPKYTHVIHEVTFLGPPTDALESSTRRKGHTHYAELHPFICAFPQTTFICVHWSLRYSRDDILQFFDKQYGGVPRNVVLWI